MINNVYTGDCLDVLKKIKDESIDLVYLDPPFYTQRIHKQKTRDNQKEFSFGDTWHSRKDYCNYISCRLKECHRILKKTGSIFLHCDTNAAHVLRLVIEEIFGEDNFRSEIIWSYRRWSNSKKGLLDGHQNIFFFSKSLDFKFNVLFQDYSPSTNIDQIVQKRVRNEHGKSSYQRKSDGTVELIDEKKGVPLSDVWDIPYLNPKAKERVGYPTQKPVILLERIITLVTDQGDIVLDPFCGSGTTLVASKILNRKYIGIDIEQEAVNLANSRLLNPIKSESILLNKGRDSYLNQNPIISEMLKSLGAVVVQRNKGIDGLLKSDNGLIPIRILRDGECEKSVIETMEKAISKNGYAKAFLLNSEAETPTRIDGKVIVSSGTEHISSNVTDLS